MDPANENIRERLLARLPQPENMAAYREEVASMLEKNEKGFRREKRYVGALWVSMVVLSTVFLCVGASRLNTPVGAGLVSLACLLILYGACELLKHFINRSRVEILKEVKQLQLQVLELHALVAKGGAQTSSNP
jgi:cobalamin biosynthesis protein CobD/CbiB